MGKKYEIHYNDGAYYGTIEFNNMSSEDIEYEIQKEIENNNSVPNKDYHISRENFKEI